MATHSFIVSALFVFSSGVFADAAVTSGKRITVIAGDTSGHEGAVLHKDMGLPQGGKNSKDAPGVRTANCAPQGVCSAAIKSTSVQTQTVTHLLLTNEQSHPAASMACLLLVVGAGAIYTVRRFPSTK